MEDKNYKLTDGQVRYIGQLFLIDCKQEHSHPVMLTDIEFDYLWDKFVNPFVKISKTKRR